MSTCSLCQDGQHIDCYGVVVDETTELVSDCDCDLAERDFCEVCGQALLNRADCSHLVLCTDCWLETCRECNLEEHRLAKADQLLAEAKERA